MRTLSVIIANYNHAHLVGGALRAMLAQSYQPSEIIIIDDGSTDNSVEVISGFEKSHPIVRLYRNEQNRGAVFTANRALALASGEYVYAAAVDDRVGPGFFERTMAMLEAHPHAGLCCSDPATFDYTGLVTESPNRWSDHPCFLSPDALADVLKGGFIAGHTSITKRSAMVEMGGFREELKWACDWFLWLAIGFRYGICYVPASLAAFRRRSDSMSAVGMRDRAQHAEVLKQVLGLIRHPEFHDVLPRFIRGGAFNLFGPQFVEVVLANADLWNVETLLLMLFPFYVWCKQLEFERLSTHAGVMNSLRPKVLWIIKLCHSEQVERVVIYGAGSHTKTLLSLWREAQGPPVERIIVTGLTDSGEFMDLPLCGSSRYEPGPNEGIVLSSNSYEIEMAATCRERWPQTPYYPLYYPRHDMDPNPEPQWMMLFEAGAIEKTKGV